MLKDPKKTKEDIIRWIKDYFKEVGGEYKAVVGISGGKDSCIVAALCKEALGANRVFGVLMPNGVQSDIEDSLAIVKHLKIPYTILNIEKGYLGLLKEVENSFEVVKKEVLINLAPRLRMALLYATAQSLPGKGLVANTCNRSEDYVGYATKFGDGAGDFSPLHDLLVSEVRQIGYELNLPKEFVDKTPSDGLCGKSDEESLGFTYEQLENYIVNKTTGDSTLDSIILEKYNKNLHKLKPMPHFKLSSNS